MMVEDTVVKGMDKFGRLVIPVTFRDAMNLRRGDDLKLSMPTDGVLRISRVYNVKSSSQEVERDIRALREVLEKDVAMCDRKSVIAAARYGDPGIAGKKLPGELERMVAEGRRYYYQDGREAFCPFGDDDAQALVVEPVLHQDICLGAVIVLAGEEGPCPVSMEEAALIRYAAQLLHRLL